MSEEPKATAEDETATIIEVTDQASEALAYFVGRAVNGHGEIADPSTARASLRRAAASISTALQALDRADKAGWTREED